MPYVQGFVTPAPEAAKDEYVALSRWFWPILREFGAERMIECWGEDVPEGHTTDFRRAVDAAPGEAVVFSWIVWPDRATCDAAAERLKTDARMGQAPPMPFDGKRMIFGGFAPVFDSEASATAAA